MATKIQVRRDSSADWTTINPVLSEGEIGFETNTGKFKIGNGSSAWSALDYFLDSSDLSGYLTVSSASTTYLTQASASTTYQQKVANISDTEIGYLDNVSSNIQTQLDSKLSSSSASTTYLTQASASTTYTNRSIDVIAAKTGAYTLASGDENDLIQLSGSNAYTVSIPTDASANFTIGTQITLLNTGTGVKTIAAVTPGTTTVNATPGLKLRAQWSSATLIKLSSNNWVVIGDLIE
jgi:hypothetical protein